MEDKYLNSDYFWENPNVKWKVKTCTGNFLKTFIFQ